MQYSKFPGVHFQTNTQTGSVSIEKDNAYSGDIKLGGASCKTTTDGSGIRFTMPVGSAEIIMYHVDLSLGKNERISYSAQVLFSRKEDGSFEKVTSDLGLIHGTSISASYEYLFLESKDLQNGYNHICKAILPSESVVQFNVHIKASLEHIAEYQNKVRSVLRCLMGRVDEEDLLKFLDSDDTPEEDLRSEILDLKWELSQANFVKDALYENQRAADSAMDTVAGVLA